MDRITDSKPLFRDKRRRAWELDFMRGVAVLAMCFDHMMFDLGNFRGWFSNSYEVMNPFMEKLREIARAYWASSGNYIDGFRFWGHAVFIFLFLFMVGTSCAFSRDNTRRGAEMGIASFLFTGISFILVPMGLMDDGVVFGILQCIAMSIIICAAVDNLTKWNKYVNFFAPLVLGVIVLSVGIADSAWIRFSDIPYGEVWIRQSYDGVFTNEHFLGYIFGTHAFGDDWFGLFPYIGFVFLGMFWGKAAYSKRKSLLPRLDGKWNRPICFVGRHALICYFVHQVIIAGIIIITCLCMGYKLSF